MRYRWPKTFLGTASAWARRLIVLIALFIALGVLHFAVSIWWNESRSSNALDELYYATVDSSSRTAFSYGLLTGDSFLSIVLCTDNAPLENMNGVKDCYSLSQEKPLKHTKTGQNDILEATYAGVTRYHCGEEITGRGDGIALLEWYLDDYILYGWDYRDKNNPKGVVFDIVFSLSRYHKIPSMPSATVEVEFKYDPSLKKLVINDDSFYVSKSGKSPDTNHPLRFLQRHGFSAVIIANDAIGAIEEHLVPEFLSCEGTDTRFSSNFEQDGVIVDVDLDADATRPWEE